MMRRLSLLAGAAALAAVLSGCTSADEAQSLADINVACTALGVGSQIAIDVVGGGAAAVLTQTIGNDVSKSCSLIVAGTQAAINQITAGNATATVTVSTAQPTGARQTRRFTARRDGATGQMVYVVPPGIFSGIPLLGQF